MALYRQGGEAVRHHHGQVVAAGIGLGVLQQCFPRGGIQAPAKVRALQVGVAVRRGAVQQERFAAAFGQ
ncbi:hypothetical protein D3C84_1064680 [compost metagenome]